MRQAIRGSANDCRIDGNFGLFRQRGMRLRLPDRLAADELSKRRKMPGQKGQRSEMSCRIKCSRVMQIGPTRYLPTWS